MFPPISRIIWNDLLSSPIIMIQIDIKYLESFMTSNHQPVYEFVRELLSEHGHSQDINDDESLILSGILDSLAVIHIVVFLEKTFNINFAEVYFDQASFDSINQILKFIEENQPVKHRNFA